MRMMVADRGTGEPISLDAALQAGKKVGPDVTNLLMEDHRVVLGWFDWYETGPDPNTKAAVARRICRALRAHMAAEEEIFYPEVEREIGDDELVRRSIQEHRSAKRLIGRIEASATVDETHDRLMAELHDEIDAHVQEEETQLFPMVWNSDMDLYALGQAVAARRVDCLFDLAASRTAARGAEERLSAEEGQLKEFPAMQISRDEARRYFVLGLKNAHATAREGRTLVDAQLRRLEQYPKLKQRLDVHAKEKDAQLSRLESILSDVGERPSAVKDTAMSMMAGVGAIAGSAAADEVIKNSFALLGLARAEAAAFETLILFGEAAGETRALKPLQQCLSEERSIASFIEENLRPTGMRFLELKSQGRQASH